MDNQFAYNRDRDWAQLVDLGHLDTGALTNENDKVKLCDSLVRFDRCNDKEIRM